MWSTILILFPVFLVTLAEENCTNYASNCTTCLQRKGCVWSIKNKVECKEYEANKPDDPDSFYIKSNVIKENFNYNITTGLTKPVEFTFEFQPTSYKKYPLDIYYLMDASFSMKAVKDDLVKQIEYITIDLNSKADLRFGFGSFIEKRTMPFVNFHPEQLKEPCENCGPTYSFKNHMSLEHNVDKFKTIVTSVNSSGNIDRPENGLDALVQVIACKEEIGWRNNSRRIVAFLTDNDFHVAGDGKLGGIVLPNDLQCHLENDSHVTDTIYDYPSVGQITDFVIENNINLLFIISDKTTNNIFLESYSRLSQKFTTSHTANSKDNLTKIVTEYYNNITANISFEARIKDREAVEVEFSIKNCNGHSSCNKSIDELLEVKVTLTPKKCLKTNITINAVSLESIIFIDLNMECKCINCSYEKDSDLCNGNGDSDCGMCKCKKEYYGDNCECEHFNGNKTFDPKCIDPFKGENDSSCHDNGKCICGKCVCEKGYRGTYCECDDNACDKVKDIMCSGNGVCNCGKCICNKDYSGKNCECINRNDTCINTRNIEYDLCSGHGECVCGKCECSETKYEGTYCENCSKCKQERCKSVYDCIINEKSNCNGELISQCDDIPANLVSCKNFFQDECTIVIYTDEVNDKNYYCKNCPVKASIIGTVLAITLLAALLTPFIVWKICTDFKDKREYEKFETERKQMEWNSEMSPLFINPITEVQNPTYRPQ